MNFAAPTDTVISPDASADLVTVTSIAFMSVTFNSVQLATFFAISL